MTAFKRILFISLCTFLLSACDPAVIGGVISTLPAAKPVLSNEDIVAGLKEALKVGATNAVSFTSKENGFLNNNLIRIPFPEDAQKVKTWAVNNGLSGQVEKFETNLNRAAEKAAAEAVPVFVNAITSMTVQDAYNILHGEQDAATQYLRKTTGAELTQKFDPIVQQAIDEVKLTSFWEPIATAYNTATIFTGGSKVNTDLKGYVNQKALDGLFYYVADEEKKIRTNPVARVNEILQKVFGSLD